MTITRKGTVGYPATGTFDFKSTAGTFPQGGGSSVNPDSGSPVACSGFLSTSLASVFADISLSVTYDEDLLDHNDNIQVVQTFDLEDMNRGVTIEIALNCLWENFGLVPGNSLLTQNEGKGSTDGWPLLQFIGVVPDATTGVDQWAGIAYQYDFSMTSAPLAEDNTDYRFIVEGFTWRIDRLTPDRTTVASGSFCSESGALDAKGRCPEDELFGTGF